MREQAPTLAGGSGQTVGISLMASAEAEAAVEYLQENVPDARIDFRDVFYKIEREGLLEFPMDVIGEYLGRELDTDIFLVTMSTYYGRIGISDGKVQIFADIQPERFKD